MNYHAVVKTLLNLHEREHYHQDDVEVFQVVTTLPPEFDGIEEPCLDQPDALCRSEDGHLFHLHVLGRSRDQESAEDLLREYMVTPVFRQVEPRDEDVVFELRQGGNIKMHYLEATSYVTPIIKKMGESDLGSIEEHVAAIHASGLENCVELDIEAIQFELEKAATHYRDRNAVDIRHGDTP